MTQCSICNTSFGVVINRRHHCRRSHVQRGYIFPLGGCLDVSYTDLHALFPVCKAIMAFRRYILFRLNELLES
jgi:hypothetical protein